MAAQLQFQSRKIGSHGDLQDVRRSQRIPAVVYGGNGENQSISVDLKEFVTLWNKIKSEATLVDLKDEENKGHKVLVRDIQKDPVKDTILHIDFQEVFESRPIRTKTAIRYVGESPGIRNEGGTLDASHHTIKVECLPGNLPASVEISLDDMHVGDRKHVSDLPALEGVKYLENKDVVLVTIAGSKRKASEAAAAAKA